MVIYKHTKAKQKIIFNKTISSIPDSSHPSKIHGQSLDGVNLVDALLGGDAEKSQANVLKKMNNKRLTNTVGIQKSYMLTHLGFRYDLA